MTIAIGEKIPDVTLRILGKDGMEDIRTGDIFANKKVLMFGVPGAFTPACNDKHLPGYVKNADQLKKEGIDRIVCVAMNDPFVMRAWGQHVGVDDKILMLPDGNGTFTKALGLTLDASANGLGTRCQRFALIAENGVVTDLQVEESAGNVNLSSASCMVERLEKAA